MKQSPLKPVLAIGAIAVLPLAAALALFMGAWTVLFEASDVERGSFRYVLGVPSEVKQLPIVQACKAPLYSWQGRDGESVPFVEISYASRARAIEILATYETALRHANCTATQREISDSSAFMKFECAGDGFVSASLQVTDAPKCASVKLDLIQNY